jgi:ubiquinone/menaquinone biosynthesis C-methylase UbiE
LRTFHAVSAQYLSRGFRRSEMAEHLCPWWMGYLLASPLRRWFLQDPETLLKPWVHTGMTVLEPGPGMGFFTLPMARMVGAEGQIVALDIQPQMLDGLRRRALRKQLLSRIDTRLVEADSMGIDDLRGRVDFVLAFAVVHEMPSAAAFFAGAAAALKSGGLLLLAEPSGHVSASLFATELTEAHAVGLEQTAQPMVSSSRAALLRKI